jgi:ABC-type hemin transport system ATPase subunit
VVHRGELLDEPSEALDAPAAARLLAGVREFDPRAALVIALHDRQSLALSWIPASSLLIRNLATPLSPAAA